MLDADDAQTADLNKYNRLTLWRPLLPYEYRCYKASCARLG